MGGSHGDLHQLCLDLMLVIDGLMMDVSIADVGIDGLMMDVWMDGTEMVALWVQ